MLRNAGISSGSVKGFCWRGHSEARWSAENVLATGLLPPVSPSLVAAVGNAALAGAEMMAVSQSARDTAERIASQATHVELSTDPGFQDEFLQSLNFHMAMPQGTR